MKNLAPILNSIPLFVIVAIICTCLYIFRDKTPEAEHRKRYEQSLYEAEKLELSIILPDSTFEELYSKDTLLK